MAAATLDDAATFMLENRFSGIPVEVDGDSRRNYYKNGFNEICCRT